MESASNKSKAIYMAEKLEQELIASGYKVEHTNKTGSFVMFYNETKTTKVQNMEGTNN